MFQLKIIVAVTLTLAACCLGGESDSLPPADRIQNAMQKFYNETGRTMQPYELREQLETLGHPINVIKATGYVRNFEPQRSSTTPDVIEEIGRGAARHQARTNGMARRADIILLEKLKARKQKQLLAITEDGGTAPPDMVASFHRTCQEIAAKRTEFYGRTGRGFDSHKHIKLAKRCDKCDKRGFVCDKPLDKGTGKCKPWDAAHCKAWHKPCPDGCPLVDTPITEPARRRLPSSLANRLAFAEDKMSYTGRRRLPFGVRHDTGDRDEDRRLDGIQAQLRKDGNAYGYARLEPIRCICAGRLEVCTKTPEDGKNGCKPLDESHCKKWHKACPGKCSKMCTAWRRTKKNWSGKCNQCGADWINCPGRTSTNYPYDNSDNIKFSA